MAKDHPDHHDAESVMRLYDLRREPVMRESRDALNASFWPATYEDMLAIARRELAFRNAEWVAVDCPPGRAVYASVKARVAKLAAARAGKTG